MRKKFIRERTRQKKRMEREQRKRMVIEKEKAKKELEHEMKERNNTGGMMNREQQQQDDGDDEEVNNNNNITNNNNSSSGHHGTTIAEIEEYYSERRFSWFLLEFANAEADYLDFARAKMASIVLWCRLVNLVVVAAILVSVAIQGERFSDASIALLTVGAVISVAVVAITVYSQYYYYVVSSSHEEEEQPHSQNYQNHNQKQKQMNKLQSTLDTVAAVLLLIASPLISIGTAYIPNSLVSNDTAWVVVYLAPLIGNGITNIAAIYRGGYFFVSVVLSSLIIKWDAAMTSANIAFLLLVSILVFLMIFFYEKILRRQFVETIVASEYSKKTLESSEEQRMLLESMVPVHVIPELVSWMASDMSTEKSIAHEQHACVAFVKLIPRRQQQQQQQYQLNSTTNSYESTATAPPTASTPSGLVGNNSEVSHQQEQERLMELEERAAWLALSHVEVDRILSELSLQLQQQHQQQNQNQESSIMSPTAAGEAATTVISIMSTGTNNNNTNTRNKISIKNPSSCLQPQPVKLLPP